MFLTKKARLASVLLATTALMGNDAKSSTPSRTADKVVELQNEDGGSSQQLACEQKNGKFFCHPLESDRLVLSTNNLIVLRGVITPQSASKFVEEFHVLENKDEVSKIYVYVKSPGGSVFAGDSIASMVKSSKKQVVMIVDFAASMAFHVAMTGTKRVMLPTGTLMQHHASGGTGAGEFPNVDKQWDWIKRKVRGMQEYEASRCKNVTYDQFVKNIDRDWWLLASEAEQAGCIDQVAKSVICSKELVEKETKEVVSIFGMNIALTWSNCPLIAYPRSIGVTNQAGFRVKLSGEETQALDDFLTLLSDPLRYYQKYNTFSVEPLQKTFDKVTTRVEY